MIVLDTNVLSEVMRPSPEPAVLVWMRSIPSDGLATTALTMAEILVGLGRLPDGRRRADLSVRLRALVAQALGNRVLPFDASAAEAYAEVVLARQRKGRPISPFDAQIAAIAASRGAAVATRDHSGFADCGIDIVDPWRG